MEHLRQTNKMAVSRAVLLDFLTAWEKCDKDVYQSLGEFVDEYTNNEMEVESVGSSVPKKSKRVKKEKKEKVLSDYQIFLADWRVKNPSVKGKAAMQQGAMAWNAFKEILKRVSRSL